MILVRTDASVAIGLGHAMRCLALVQALRDEGGDATFLMAGAPPAFAARAAAEDVHVAGLAAEPGSAADAAETVTRARASGARWVVVDGYHFGGDYQRALVDAGLQVLALDDHGHAEHYWAQLVLNQNLGASADAYAAREPHTRLLLGVRHVLLRREFRAYDAEPRPVPERARTVLMTLGGSDPDNTSTRLLASVAGVSGPLEIQVLVGGANPYRAALEQAAAASPHTVTLVVDAHDMAARMAWADLALAAAGGTAWELARVGTPQLSVAIADNQRPAAAALAAQGVAVGLGWHADLTEAAVADAVTRLVDDAAARADLADRGRTLIDGLGAVRVLEAMGLSRVRSAA